MQPGWRGGPRFAYQLPTVVVTAPVTPSNGGPNYWDVLEASIQRTGGGAVQIVEKPYDLVVDDPFYDPTGRCTEGVTLYPTVDLAHESSVLCPQGRENVCIDVYIPDSTANWILRGDASGSDPNAPFGASRAQVVIFPAERRWYVVVSKTCWAWQDGSRQGECTQPLKVDTVASTSLLANFVEVKFRDSGVIEMQMQLHASKLAPAGRVQVVLPAIDATVLLAQAGSGKWLTAGERNKFPALDIWHWRPSIGTHDLLAKRDPLNPFALIDRVGRTDSWCHWRP